MGIQIESIILHLLDPQQSQPVCSQRPLPQTTDPRVFEYFTKHIVNSQSDPKVREARFKNLNEPSAAACRGILEGKTDLVDGSQALARSLFGILKANQSISRGDLAVCLYQDGADGTTRRLALLKIDPVEGFRHAVKQVKGETYVEVEIDTELMPSTSQELQKCAFVRLRDPQSAESDMMLLDLQGREEKVAQFFTWTFLGAELMADPRETTRQVAKAVVDLETELFPLGEWEPFRREVRTALAGPDARLTKKWVGSLPISQEAKKKVETRLADSQILDRTLPLDGNLLAKLTEKVKYQGNYGLKIEVLRIHHDDVVKSITPKKRKAGTDYFEIVIHTPTLKRVS